MSFTSRVTSLLRIVRRLPKPVDAQQEAAAEADTLVFFARSTGVAFSDLEGARQALTAALLDYHRRLAAGDDCSPPDLDAATRPFIEPPENRQEP